ncbi:hypothetical protein FRC11_013257 [Ceratobasidium sp. 423]|nr:hypothetical protein FRC11_013257 [Ceratobasidium sp. 423]
MSDSPKKKDAVSRNIENVQFKVHKSKLIKSETFADMFTVAEGSNTDGKITEGSSTDHPIKLEGLGTSDFECLLTFLYEGHYTRKRPKLELPLIFPAFRLAHMWNFAELRAYLLPFLQRSLDDVDKIVYAREFGIEGWTTPAYIKLRRRTNPLSTEEAEKIGFKCAMLIFRLREERYVAAHEECCGKPSTVIGQAIEERIAAWEKDGQVFTVGRQDTKN